MRADPDTCEALLEPGAELIEMRSRPMRGWLHVDIERVESDADLEAWVRSGLAYAQSRPTPRRFDVAFVTSVKKERWC